MLIGKEFAGSPDPHLHLIKDKDQIVIVADLPDLAQIACGGDNDTPFTLDRLEENRTGEGRNGPPERIGVIERHMLETVEERIKELLYLLLPGCRNSRHGPAVKRSECGDNLEPVGAELFPAVFPGQLYGRLVCLGAAVAEECPVGEGVVAEKFSQLDLLRYMIIVGAVDKLRRLLLQGRNNLRMTMTQVVYRHPGQKIEILSAVCVPQVAPFTPYRDKGIPSVGFHDIVVCLIDPLFGIHLISFPSVNPD